MALNYNYDFLEGDGEEEHKLNYDYSFLDEDRVNEATGEPLLKQRETYDLSADKPDTNLGRSVERVKLMQTGGMWGMARAAVNADPHLSDLASRLRGIYDEATADPYETAKTIINPQMRLLEGAKELVDFSGAMATKGIVDIADQFTAGDIRADVGEAAEIVSAEAQKGLGDPAMQYTGSDAQRFGYQVVEGAANMVPALTVGWMSKNPGLSLGMMGMEVAGMTYNEYMDKTGDHDRAMLAAQFHTAAEIIPETIPVLAILRKTRAGEGIKRMLEATIGEGAQEMLTEILQGTYDRKDLEGMSLQDAIRNIDWGDVAHAGAIGFFVGGTLATPGAIADQIAGKKRYDQQGQPPELFTPTYKAGGGIEVMPATKKGRPVRDVYIARDGQVIRDTNAISLQQGVDPVTFDVSATVESIKDEIGFDEGLVASAAGVDPYGQEQPVDMPLGELGPTLPSQGLVADQMGVAPDLVEQQQADAVRPKEDIAGDLTEQAIAETPAPEPPPTQWGPVAQPEVPPVSEQAMTEKPAQPQVALPGEAPETAEQAQKGEWEPVEVPSLDEEANAAATSPQNGLDEPTEGQKEQGNYKKGHPHPSKTQGFRSAIENPAGSKRKPDWPELTMHYGYIKGTEGADSEPGAAPHEREQVDAFFMPQLNGAPIPDDMPVFIVDQATADGAKFDEHKVIFGVRTESEAREAYLSNYQKNWKGLGNISQVTPDQLREWLDTGDQQVEYGKPIAKPDTPKQKALREGKPAEPGLESIPDKPIEPDSPKTDEWLNQPDPPKDKRGLDEVEDETGVYSEDEVSTGKRESIGPVAEPKSGQRDLLAPSKVPGKTAKTQSSDSFNIRYEQVETGTLRARSDTATTPEEIAHLTASLRKHAQEVFYAVVTDADGKVLNVIRHSKGTRDGASVYPIDVVGAIANTPGGQNFWFVHNHPSTTASPSQADLRITETLVNATEGLGMDFNGHVIIAGTNYAYFNQGYYVSESADTGKIPAGRRTEQVGVTERILRMKQPGDRVTITSPRQTQEYVQGLDSESGLVLLNNRNVALGVIALSPEEMMKLRDGKQVRRILSAIDSTNASAGISFIKKKGMALDDGQLVLENLGNYLARVPDFRVLDSIFDNGNVSEAAAESGRSLGSKDQPFYRRDTSYAQFDGKEISYEIEVEDTGKTYTVTVDAGVIMRDIDTRLNALQELRGCI